MTVFQWGMDGLAEDTVFFISRRAWQIYYVGITNIEIRMGTSVQDETLLYLLQKVLKHVENTDWPTKVL